MFYLDLVEYENQTSHDEGDGSGKLGSGDWSVECDMFVLSEQETGQEVINCPSESSSSSPPSERVSREPEAGPAPPARYWGPSQDLIFYQMNLSK